MIILYFREGLFEAYDDVPGRVSHKTYENL